MDLTQAIRSRRMVRSFSPRPVDPAVVASLIEDSLRAPTAGNTQGTAWLVLDSPGDLARYWECTTTPAWRERSGRWPGLSRAPVAALSLAEPGAYVARYGEPDKAGSGLGGPAASEADWPVPYWFGDAAFATMALLLGAAGSGLGACFLGSFRGEREVLDAFGVPEGWRLFGTVLLGHPDGGDHRSPSISRPGPGPGDRIHTGRWGAGGVRPGRTP